VSGQNSRDASSNRPRHLIGEALIYTEDKSKGRKKTYTMINNASNSSLLLATSEIGNYKLTLLNNTYKTTTDFAPKHTQLFSEILPHQ